MTKPVLKKLTKLSLIMNKKRTIVTIIGIILATALITAVATMASSFQWSFVDYEKLVSGNFHYVFYQVPKDKTDNIINNRNVEEYFETSELGYSVLDGCKNEDKPYLFLMAMDNKAMENSSMKLVEGRLPQNMHEVVISKHIQTNGGVKYQVGDTLKLNLGQRYDSSGIKLGQMDDFYPDESFETEKSAEFTIVGIVQRLSDKIEPYRAPGYSVITYLPEEESGEFQEALDKVDIYTRYTKEGIKNRQKVTADILGIDPELFHKDLEELTEEEMKQLDSCYAFYENTYLIRYETLDFHDSTFQFIYSVAAIVITIIMVTSIFCIRNSFAVSITEKMKQYGMLASVGATPRQIRKNVFYEAAILGGFGIPIGLGSGVFACWAVIAIINKFFQEGIYIGLVFRTSILAIICGAVLATITIILSAIRPAMRAAKVSPIVAMNASEDVKIGKKDVKAPKFVKKIFGMGGLIAYKNMKRNRKKYRVAIASIAISVITFIPLYYFTQLGFRSVDYYANDDGCNLRLWVQDDKKQLEVAEKTLNLEGVKASSFMRTGYLWVKESEIPYQEKALEIYPYENHGEYETIMVSSLGKAEYQRYLDQLGLQYEDVKNQAILMNESYGKIDNKYTVYESTKYHAGDVISGFYDKHFPCSDDMTPMDDNNQPLNPDTRETVTIAAVTDKKPFGLGAGVYNGGYLIVSDEWMEAHNEDTIYYDTGVYYNCEDPDAFQQILERDYDFSTDQISNMEQQKREQKSMMIIIAIFLYGFITVISLIGITNIINTIVTSMELRSKEFAMLRSIGMTKREFRRMVRMESIFYGTKALGIGIVIGSLLSYLIYERLSNGIDVGFQLPIGGIMISIIAVVLLLAGIMRYSLAKVQKQNIIETIRQDNI